MTESVLHKRPLDPTSTSHSLPPNKRSRSEENTNDRYVIQRNKPGSLSLDIHAFLPSGLSDSPPDKIAGDKVVYISPTVIQTKTADVEGCHVASAKVLFKDAIYQGQLEASLPNNQGTLTVFDSNTKYVGIWAQGAFVFGVAAYTGNKTYDGLWNEGSFYHGIMRQSLSEGNVREIKVVYTTGKITKIKIAYASGAVYKGEGSEEGIPHGMGELKKPTASDENWVHYKGKFVDGKPNGEGWAEFPNGSIYNGSWQNDKFHGEGKWTNSNAQGNQIKEYMGSFVDSLPEGPGVAIMANGIVYNSSWLKGELHGKGTLTNPNATDSQVREFVGIYYEVEKRGHGKAVSPNGLEYEGTWLNGRYNGKGKWTNPNAQGNQVKEYVGNFADGLREGKGRAVLANGTVYNGSWQNDKFHGEGKWTNPNAQDNQIKEYVGNFVNGLREGPGKAVLANGIVYNGSWKNDKFHGIGEWVSTNAQGNQFKKYMGYFVDGKPEGHGEGIFANEIVYNGSWLKGTFHGKGIWTNPNAKDNQVMEYVGDFVDGRREGQGEGILANGIVCKGSWRKGTFHDKRK